MNSTDDSNEIIGELIVIKPDFKYMNAGFFNQERIPQNYDNNLVHLVKLKKKDIAHQSNLKDFYVLYKRYRPGQYCDVPDTITTISPTNFQKFLENNQEYYTNLCIYEERQKKYETSKITYIEALMSKIE